MGRTLQRARWPLIIPAALAVAFLAVPLGSLLVRADWGNLGSALADGNAWPAIRLSLATTLTTTVLAAALGTPLAWLLATATGRAAGLVRGLVTVPLVLPPVVGGVALLLAFGRTGTVGSGLDAAFGLTIPFTPVAVVMAETFVAMPFYVITVEGAMRTLDARYDQIAATLGASPWHTFTRVIVPLVGPGIAAGAALAWARAFGEFGATITFAGNFVGRTQTAPLAVYTALDASPEAAIALSLVMLAVSAIVLIALRGRWAR